MKRRISKNAWKKFETDFRIDRKFQIESNTLKYVREVWNTIRQNSVDSARYQGNTDHDHTSRSVSSGNHDSFLTGGHSFELAFSANPEFIRALPKELPTVGIFETELQPPTTE